MVEEEVPIHTEGSEDSPDSSESTSLYETDCRRKKHFIGPKNKTKCRLRRTVRNRRFLNAMLRCASSSSSDSDHTYTLQENSDTEDDSDGSTSEHRSSTIERSDYSSSHERLLSSESSTTTSDSSSNSSSEDNRSNNSSDSSASTETDMTESGCNSSDYETLSTDDDEY